MQITIIEKKLTDGSLVYDLSLSDDGSGVTVQCITLIDANTLAEKIAKAFEHYANVIVHHYFLSLV